MTSPRSEASRAQPCRPLRAARTETYHVEVPPKFICWAAVHLPPNPLAAVRLLASNLRRSVLRRGRGSLPFVLGGLLASAATTNSSSQPATPSPIAARQAAMKQIAANMKLGSGFATGQFPWNAAQVDRVMSRLVASGGALRTMFPAASAHSPESSADPRIWRNKADFDKRLAEFTRHAAAASKASDPETFRTSFRQLGSTCKSCHDLYRTKAP